MEQQQPTQQRVFINFSTQPILVYGIIAVLAVIHLYVSNLSPYDNYRFYLDYANVGPAVTQGEYYRLLTSMFLHADMFHLFFNCMGLYAFGREIETLFGHVRFALIYLLGGLAGSVASYAVTNGASIGASGAVFAVFGALAAYFYQHRELYGETAKQQLRSMAVLAAVNLGIGLVSNVPGSTVRIDNAAHIGGAIGGFLLALAITPHYSRRMGFNEETGQITQVLVDTSLYWRWVPVSFAFASGLIGVVIFLVNARG